MSLVESQQGLRKADKNKSLIRRATMGVVLAEVICMVALAGLSVGHEWKVRLRAMNVMLEGRADSLFGAIQDAEDEGDSVRLDAREISIPKRDFFAVYDGADRQIGASIDAPVELLRLHPGSAPFLHTERVGRHSYRVLQKGYLRIVDRGESVQSGLPRPVTIVYATELDRIWREVFEAVEYFLGISLALTLSTTIMLVAFLRSALRPISALAVAAGAVSSRDLAFQAPAEALAIRELRPLTLTLTSMIDELRLSFDREHRFLGDAAHELKTAVAVVKSSLQLMLLRPRSVAEYERGLQSAVSDNARAEELIARMLLMARLQEAPAPYPVRANPERVVKACLQKIRPLLDKAGLGVTVSWPRLPATEEESREEDAALTRTVPVAAEYLEVVFTNLLVNAVEHSGPGSQIIVSAEESDGGVWVKVADEGEGISAEAQQHIFERFFRADQSRARLTGGAGLGLSIAKAIVDGAGGMISVASVPGEGTEMTVFLPFDPSKENIQAELETR